MPGPPTVPLNDTEIMNVKLMMGYNTLTTVFDWRLYPSVLTSDTVFSLSDPEAAEVRALLVENDDIKYDADKLNARGLDSNPRRTSLKLTQRMSQIFGVPPATYSGVLYRR